MTVNMASTDKASSPPMRYSSHDARGIDDLGRSAGVGWVVQAGSAGESHEQGETEREDGNCMNRRRGTRANNGKGRSRKSRRPKHNQSSCSEEGTVERREDCVESFRRETHWEPRSDGDAGLEAELFPMPLPGELHTSASKKDGGNNGLGRAVSAKEIGKSSEDISGGRRSEGVADWRSDSYTVHPKGEKSNTKSSPRTSTLEMTSAARTAYHPVEKGAQRSSSTVLAESVSQRRERRSENRLLCQTRRVEDGDQYVMERKQQAKRLALEVAKLRSALRVSNSDLAAERKARARLENDLWEQAQAWGHERGVIVSARHEAERALQAAQEELTTLRKHAKARAAAHEVSHRKTQSALNRVIKVQDRLVQALQTEVDLTNRARSAAQVDAHNTRQQLHQFDRDFLSWRDRAKLLEDQIDKLGHPLRRPHDRDPPNHTRAPPILLASSAQSYRSKEGQSNHGKEPRSTDGSISWKDSEFPAGNREVERNGDDTKGSAGKGSLGGREGLPQRDPGSGHTNEADAPGFINKGTVCTLHDIFDDDRHPHVSRGSEKTTATPEACLVSTNEAMPSSTEPLDLKENFQRSMRAQQEISTRIESELARARADLNKIYACNRNKKGAADAAITVASPEDRNDPGFFADGDREAPGNGDDCDVGTNHNADEVGVLGPHDEVGVPGPHSARVLAALLGVGTSRNGKVCGTAAGVAGVMQPSSKPHLRLSDYPPQIQAVFRREPPPLTGVPTPINDKMTTPRLYQPPGGTHPQAAAAREKGETASSVTRGKAEERSAIVGAFREYKPKSPMLRMWLAEKSSPASPLDEGK